MCILERAGMMQRNEAFLTVRPMRREDISSIVQLEKTCFSSPWSQDTLLSELTNDTARFFSAFYHENFAGYLGANNICGEVYIGNIAVFPEFRRLHIATALLENLFDSAQKEKANLITLEVRLSNLPAIYLYKKFGFFSMGERPNFYSSPTENALIMTKYLQTD